MSSPHDQAFFSASPQSIRRDTPSPVRTRASISTDPQDHPRVSPTLTRSFNPNDPDFRERQRTMDVDMALQLSRARSHTISSPSISPTATRGPILEGYQDLQSPFPVLSNIEEQEFDAARVGGPTTDVHPTSQPFQSDESFTLPVTSSPPFHVPHLDSGQDASLLATLDSSAHLGMSIPMSAPDDDTLSGLPMYQPIATCNRYNYDFTLMEDWAHAEKDKLGIRTPGGITIKPPEFIRRKPSQQGQPAEGAGGDASQAGPSGGGGGATPFSITLPQESRVRQRKLSQSIGHRRRQPGSGKMALFEGQTGAPPPSFSPGSFGAIPSYEHFNGSVPGVGLGQGHDRPYRFSFYSNALSATIHARSLSELPADGQTFQQLFSGVEGTPNSTDHSDPNTRPPSVHAPTPMKPDNGQKRVLGTGGPAGHFGNGVGSKIGGNGSKAPTAGGSVGMSDTDSNTWWLDVLSPTDDEMKMLSKVFGIHPLTTEDIQMEETREKIELFRNYYFVCFRSFDQDPYSPTYLEPLNMYVVVFREGTLSFHFRPTPHPSNVRRRIKQLKDYISVTSDWISYALIDDITDAFGPLIQSIEYEVDSIDELVLILKEAEQSDMLRRIGTCRKKVMGLLRLMGNKADVVKGLAKRCNENWRVAPTSDIGLYLSDIQDHLITMTQNLNHYEKILSRSHSNYLAQISIEMTDANNQINDVLSKLTALGTVLIPMNLVTGLWGMNVHVPGQDIVEGYTWFLSIIGVLVAFAIIGGYSTYKLMTR